MVFSTTKKLALALVAAMAFGMAPAIAQDPPKPADKPQKVAKDDAEASLINSIPKTTDPAEKIKILDKWSRDYPETAFETERFAEYLKDYGDLKDFQGQSKVAEKWLASHPNDESALRTIIGGIYQIKNPSEADLSRAEKASNYLVDNANTVYAASNMPAGANAAQWDGLKGTMVLAAKNTIPYIDLQRKDIPKEEADLTKLLQAEPGDVSASNMLAAALFGERQAHPEKQPAAIFEFARVGAYAGPGAMPAATRPQVLTSTKKMYTQYHGSDEGWDKLVALATANPLPPSDWTIESTTAIAIRKAKEDEERDKADPVGTIWRTVHDGLTGDGDAAFWEQAKDAQFPGKDANGTEQKFKGKLVSFKPAIGNPKTLVISVKDPAGDVTLQLDMPLRGKMEPGAELEFDGQAVAYTKSPYMLTLKIDDPKTEIVGWKPIAPARGPARGPKKP